MMLLYTKAGYVVLEDDTTQIHSPDVIIKKQFNTTSPPAGLEADKLPLKYMPRLHPRNKLFLNTKSASNCAAWLTAYPIDAAKELPLFRKTQESISQCSAVFAAPATSIVDV